MKDEIFNYLRDVKPTKSIKEDTLKYCPKCNSVWENVYRAGYKKKLTPYPGLPSYGKVKEVCLDCRELDSGGVNIGFDHKDYKAGKICMSCESPDVNTYDNQGFAICQECEESSACYCGAFRGEDCKCSG